MNITDKAKGFLQEIMAEQNVNNIRVFFAGMGWGGPQLGMSLDETLETDIVKEVNGIQVGFDKTIYDQTNGLSLDLSETIDGKGLTLTGDESDCC